MFTGLVERTGQIKSIQSLNQGIWTMIVDPGPDFERTLGASIAVNGVCLSEIDTKTDGDLTFHVSQESLAKTTLGQLKIGSKVNLERAMKASDRLGGHIVLGHVDGTAMLIGVEATGAFTKVTLSVSHDLAKYIVCKGSIAVNGISLTVNEVIDLAHETHISLTLVPITWNTTNMSMLKNGDKVNIEVDMIAKHIERLTIPWKKA